MTQRPLNPYLRERALTWSNRFADWRANPDETWFHAAALATGIALALYLVAQALPALSDTLRNAIGRWPVPLLVCSLVIIHLRHSEALRACRSRLQRHWLAAQPIAPVIAQRMLRRLQLFDFGLYALGVGAVLLFLGQSLFTQAIWLSGCALAIVTARLYGHDRAGSRGSGSGRLPFAITAYGSFWRWQWIEACAVLAPRRLAGALWLLLLAPAGHWSALVIALVLVLLYLLISAWHASVSVLAAAERWLATQPLEARRWLLTCVPIPALILVVAGTLVAAILAATENLRQAPVVLVAMCAIAMLHFACAAAERRRPRRTELVFALHLLVLVALLQSMPLLLAPAWLAQLIWLARRSLRP